MKRDTMYAISPLDGRYSDIGEELAPCFSEYALVKNRVKVEVKWLVFLIENINEVKALESLKEAGDVVLIKIEDIYTSFNEESYTQIKEIENTTKHDVKAVELFVAEKLKEIGLKELVSFVHIGCTSEDINNTAYANMIQEGLEKIWIPTAEELIEKLALLAKRYKDVPMLAHTHGQPATPTTVGKELAVFVHRLQKSLDIVKMIKPCAKFNGATGTYAAISTAFSDKNWSKLCKSFVEDYLELEFSPLTTQIENYDSLCHIFDGVRNFNNIVLDLDVDMWLYISREYFKQITVKEEVGSSTMPHKVNPIKFENSESNIDMSNAILMALSNKLPRSRMQRDLSDSSSKRNIGVAFGYSLQAIRQTIGGLGRVEINEEKIKLDLDTRWEVLAEPIQTVLRKYGIPDAYNQLKVLTRGKEISKETIQEFIKSIDVLSDEDKRKLLKMAPSSYIGLAAQIVEDEI